jgi:outer membrane protein OmpA-like peptidoglycan-associated protein
VVDRWNPYRQFTFDVDQSELPRAEASKVSEIAAYLKKNPSLQVGIDGSILPRDGSDTHDQDLSNRRVEAVRSSSIQAGVPAERIKVGAFGDPQMRRDARVDLLISTSS